MGSCLTKKPIVEAEVQADGNVCCDDNMCPSSCCVIVIRQSTPKGIKK